METPGVASEIVTVCGVLKVAVRGERLGSAAGTCTASVAALLAMLLKLAVILVVPIATAVAPPDELIVATAGFEDDQVADCVRYCVLPSL